MSVETESSPASKAAGDSSAAVSSMPQDRIEDWQLRWQQGRIGFHLSAVNEDLVRFYDRLVPEDKPCTVLLPLCGKSLDMIWLHNRGHTVIGIEAVTKAVVEFFTENNLQYSVTKINESTDLYRTEDGRLQIFRADIFCLSAAQLPKIDCIWDRASYVAILVSDRAQYAALLRSVLPPGGRLLLSLLQYSSPLADAGPPRSVTERQFRPEFEHVADVECLLKRQRNAGTVRPLVRYDAADIEENIYLITKR